MLVCGVLMWLIARWTPAFDFVWLYGDAVFGFVLLVGVVLLAAGARAFFKHKTIIRPDRESLTKMSALVTTGVFRYTRNPLYLGLATLLVAWTIYLSNWLSALGVVLFVAFITRYQIKPEERALEGIFGEEYVQYKQKVRRWV